MRWLRRILDALFILLAVLLLAALLQGYLNGGWLRRLQYTSLAENAWRERIYTVTWRDDALEFQFDRTDYLIIEDCQCGGMGNSRWNLYLTNARLRGPHARDAWRHIAIGAVVRNPDASQHFVTFWVPHWLPIAVLALPLIAAWRRTRKSTNERRLNSDAA